MTSTAAPATVTQCAAGRRARARTRPRSGARSASLIVSRSSSGGSTQSAQRHVVEHEREVDPRGLRVRRRRSSRSAPSARRNPAELVDRRRDGVGVHASRRRARRACSASCSRRSSAARSRAGCRGRRTRSARSGRGARRGARGPSAVDAARGRAGSSRSARARGRSAATRCSRRYCCEVVDVGERGAEALGPHRVERDARPRRSRRCRGTCSRAGTRCSWRSGRAGRAGRRCGCRPSGTCPCRRAR